MAQDITSSIDIDDITGGDATNDRSDHENAWNSAIVVLNSMLNAGQEFDGVHFEDLASDLAAPAGNLLKLYNVGGTLYIRSASAISTIQTTTPGPLDFVVFL